MMANKITQSHMVAERERLSHMDIDRERQFVEKTGLCPVCRIRDKSHGITCGERDCIQQWLRIGDRDDLPPAMLSNKDRPLAVLLDYFVRGSRKQAKRLERGLAMAYDPEKRTLSLSRKETSVGEIEVSIVVGLLRGILKRWQMRPDIEVHVGEEEKIVFKGDVHHTIRIWWEMGNNED